MQDQSVECIERPVSMISEAGDFRLGSLGTALYIPNLLFAIGRGAVVPVIALIALDLGASPAMAGVVVALRGIGTMAFDVPAGILISRMGEKQAMIACAVALAAIATGVWLRPPLWLFAVLVALIGCTWSVWHIARIAFASGSSIESHRGRVMALTGGSTRIGLLVGPLVVTALVSDGTLTRAFLVLAVVSGAAALSMALAREVPFTPELATHAAPPTVAGVLRDHRHILATAGVVALTAQVLRSAREVLIPLWGDRVGIDAATIPLIFAASYAVETVFSYPAGVIMDRKGRKWAFVPCIALLAVGIGAIPLTADTPTLTAVAMLIGLGNGFGSGMNMTLGSDLAPLRARSRFLGVWRLITDFGNAGGPLLIAVVTAAASLAAASSAVAGVGLLGLAVLWRRVPETRLSDEASDGGKVA